MRTFCAGWTFLPSKLKETFLHRSPGPVVVVEDNETDLYLLKRFLSAEPPVQHLLRARDGEEGIELLNEFASGGRGSLPDLIVVDLNLPRVNGHEVLAHLRAQQVFQKTL